MGVWGDFMSDSDSFPLYPVQPDAPTLKNSPQTATDSELSRVSIKYEDR